MFSNEALEELKNIASSAGGVGGGKQLGLRMPMVHETPGRKLLITPNAEGATITVFGPEDIILFGIESLALARRCLHTILEGNRFFIRTKSSFGLLALCTSGPSIRFAFVDGTWVGDVSRDEFIRAMLAGQ
jgi:hypothetical protein